MKVNTKTIMKMPVYTPHPFAWRPHSIRMQLMLWNMLTLALLLGVVGLIASSLVRSIMIASIDRELEQRSEHVGEGPLRGFGGPGAPQPRRPEGAGGRDAQQNAAPPQPGAPPSQPPAPADGFRQPHTDWRRAAFRRHNPPFRIWQDPDTRPRFLDLEGHVIGPGTETQPWDPGAVAAAAAGKEVFTEVDVNDEPIRILSRPFPVHGPIRGVSQSPYPLEDVERAVSGLDAALLALIPLALLGSAAAGAFLTDRALRPVRHVARAANRIGAQDLAERLVVSGKDEFWELASAFNGMMGRLDSAFEDKKQLVGRLEDLVEQQRRFTADASHELRTPLGVIKANTTLSLTEDLPEGDIRQSLEDIDRAADSMTRLVLDLLMLARSDAGQLGRHRIPLPAREVLQKAAGRATRIGGAPIRVDVSDVGLCVMGNEDEVLRVISNLLENARRHTPDSGLITMMARQEEERVHLWVADTGIGIAPDQLPHLGQRFYRVDAARSRPDGGTGLGLSICKGIVEAHGGTISFESTLGVGTTVHVTLPAAEELS